MKYTQVSLIAALVLSLGAAAEEPAGAGIEHGVYQVHLLLHAIGTEEYTITGTHDGRRVLTTTTSTNDRGMKRTSVSPLTFGDHFEPLKLEQKSGDIGSTTEIYRIKATVND